MTVILFIRFNLFIVNRVNILWLKKNFFVATINYVFLNSTCNLIDVFAHFSVYGRWGWFLCIHSHKHITIRFYDKMINLLPLTNNLEVIGKPITDINSLCDIRPYAFMREYIRKFHSTVGESKEMTSVACSISWFWYITIRLTEYSSLSYFWDYYRDFNSTEDWWGYIFFKKKRGTTPKKGPRSATENMRSEG